MRIARLGLAATAVAVGLIVPSSASAQVDSVSVASATLSPLGEPTVVLDVACDPRGVIIHVEVSLTQVKGTREASAFSYPPRPADPAIPCLEPSTQLAVGLPFRFGDPFTPGKAVTGGTITWATNFLGFPIIVTEPFGPEDVKIKKK